MLSEWNELTDYVPDEPPICSVGIKDHKWELSIEDGSLTVVLAAGEECPTWHDMKICELHLGDFLEIGYMAPIPVSVTWETDCPGGGWYENGSHYVSHPDRCDCNHWPELHPIHSTQISSNHPRPNRGHPGVLPLLPGPE